VLGVQFGPAVKFGRFGVQDRAVEVKNQCFQTHGFSVPFVAVFGFENVPSSRKHDQDSKNRDFLVSTSRIDRLALMKGTNLVSVANSQRTDLPFPLEGVKVTTLFLLEPRTESLEVEVLYLALEGQVVLDLPSIDGPGEFVHLRKGEAVKVLAGTRAVLSPVGEAVVLRVASTLP
jgi:hypothetical protein